jgi:hypothetical protein
MSTCCSLCLYIQAQARHRYNLKVNRRITSICPKDWIVPGCYPKLMCHLVSLLPNKRVRAKQLTFSKEKKGGGNRKYHESPFQGKEWEKGHTTESTARQPYKDQARKKSRLKVLRGNPLSHMTALHHLTRGQARKKSKQTPLLKVPQQTFRKVSISLQKALNREKGRKDKQRSTREV